jgi:hypothetical protein
MFEKSFRFWLKIHRVIFAWLLTARCIMQQEQQKNNYKLGEFSLMIIIGI